MDVHESEGEHSDNDHAGQPLEKLREPDGEIKAYAQAHGITLDLWSTVTQRVLKYRIAVEKQRTAAEFPPAPLLSEERRKKLVWEPHWGSSSSSSDRPDEEQQQ